MLEDALQSNTLEKYVTIGLLTIFVSTAFLYGYLLHSMVQNVVSGDKIEQEMSAIASEVSELEFRYISLQSGIDTRFANAIGFFEPNEIAYISRVPFASGLSLEINDR